jgi:thymidylate synthase (FAD)
MAQVKVLDFGYVEYVESWGSDERIIEAARMSTDKGFLGWGPLQCDCAGDPSCKVCKGTGLAPGDEKLLKYLYAHHHDTPFEMAGLVIEIQAPIMVFREWHRHRTQSYNELSARYTPMPDVNYMPTAERCLMVNGANKQANAVKGADELTHESVLEWLEELSRAYNVCEAVYQSGLRRGIPKELARLPVNVGRYSRMRASANLRNWLGFLTLRSDVVPSGAFAQYEIRQFANVVANIIQQQFPRTYELFAAGGR